MRCRHSIRSVFRTHPVCKVQSLLFLNGKKLQNSLYQNTMNELMLFHQSAKSHLPAACFFHTYHFFLVIFMSVILDFQFSAYMLRVPILFSLVSCFGYVLIMNLVDKLDVNQHSNNLIIEFFLSLKAMAEIELNKKLCKRL